MDDSQRKGIKYIIGKRVYPSKTENILFYLIFFCIINLIQGMLVSGITPAGLPTMEKAFGFSSLLMSNIFMSYNFSFAIFSLIFGYFGKYKRIFCISLGVSFVALGSTTIALPNFLGNTYKNSDAGTGLLCGEEHKKIPRTNTYWLNLITLCLGFILIGIGSTPLQTLSITVIYDYTSEKDEGIYSAVFFLFGAIGPAFGFLISNLILKIPVDITGQNMGSKTPNDESWIGAWWLMYVIGAIPLVLLAIPLLLLPQWLEKQRVSASNNDEEECNDGFLSSLSEIYRCRALIPISIGATVEAMSTSAVLSFISKFIIHELDLNNSQASLYGGILVLLGAFSGLMIGGLFVKLSRFPPSKMIIFITIGSCIAAIFTSAFSISHNSQKIIGVDINSEKIVVSFTSDCATNCKCSISDFYPVCVNQTETYYSPCVAGCNNRQGVKGEFKFKECTCLTNQNVEVNQGWCKTPNTNLTRFVILCLFYIFISILTFVPLIDLIFGLNKKKNRTLMSGIQQLMVRIGCILGPLILGHLIDRTCVMMSPNSDGGWNCLYYDNYKLSITFVLWTLITKLITIISFFISSVMLIWPTRNNGFIFQVSLETADES